MLLGHSLSLSAQEEPPREAGPAPEMFAGRDRLDFADGLYGRNMFDMAAEEYARLIGDFPGHVMLSDAYYRRGESFFFLEQYDQAIQAYDAYLTQFPGHTQNLMARLRTGESLYQLGRKDEAFERLKPVLASDDPFLKNAANYYTGRILMEKGNLQESAGYFAEVTRGPENNPFYGVAAYHLGKSALEQGRHDEALSAFEKAVVSDNAEIKTYAEFGIGQAAYHKEDYKTAAEHFSKAYETAAAQELKSDAFMNYLTALYEAHEYDAILGQYEKGSGLSPDQTRAALGIAARCAYQLEKYDDAAELYRKLASSSDVSEEMKRDAAEGVVESYLAGDKVKEASEAVDAAAIPLDRASERWLYLAQEAEKRAGSNEKALETADVLLKRFPESQYKTQAMMNRGYILVETGKAQEARKAFDDFLIAYPDHKHAKQTLINRITLDMTLADWDSAVQSSTAFIEVYGDSKEAEDIRYQLGSLYISRKEYAEASKLFEEFRAAYPESGRTHEAFFYLGYALQMQEKFKEAGEYYAQVEKDEVTPEIHFASLKNLAYAYVRMEQYGQAADAYFSIIEQYTGKELTADIYFWLADFYQRRGEGEKLRVVMEQLKEVPQAKDKPAMVQFFFGEALRLTGAYEEAVSHYNTALAYADVPQAETLLGKALSEMKLEKFDSAALGFEEAISAARDNHSLALDARLYLADTFFQQQRYKEAGKAYLSAAILYENADKIPPALIKAGESFEKAGLRNEAIKAYEELLTRFKASPLAPGAEEKLGQLRKIAV